MSADERFNADELEDPHGYILRQGWTTLDFSDEAKIDAPHPGPLPIRCGEGERRLYETLQLEIIAVLESLNRLRESPDYELCQLSEKKPGVLEELAAERKKLLEKESGELQQQADKLAEEIKELGGEAVRILQRPSRGRWLQPGFQNERGVGASRGGTGRGIYAASPHEYSGAPFAQKRMEAEAG